MVRVVPPDEVSQQVFDRPTTEKDFISSLGRQRGGGAEDILACLDEIRDEYVFLCLCYG
jgi:hypothetical protein